MLKRLLPFFLEVLGAGKLKLIGIWNTNTRRVLTTKLGRNDLAIRSAASMELRRPQINRGRMLSPGKEYAMFTKSTSYQSTATPPAISSGMIFKVARVLDTIIPITTFNNNQAIAPLPAIYVTFERISGQVFDDNSDLNNYIAIYEVTRTPQADKLTAQPDLFSLGDLNIQRGKYGTIPRGTAFFISDTDFDYTNSNYNGDFVRPPAVGDEYEFVFRGSTPSSSSAGYPGYTSRQQLSNQFIVKVLELHNIPGGTGITFELTEGSVINYLSSGYVGLGKITRTKQPDKVSTTTVTLGGPWVPQTGSSGQTFTYNDRQANYNAMYSSPNTGDWVILYQSSGNYTRVFVYGTDLLQAVKGSTTSGDRINPGYSLTFQVDSGTAHTETIFIERPSFIESRFPNPDSLELWINSNVWSLRDGQYVTGTTLKITYGSTGPSVITVQQIRLNSATEMEYSKLDSIGNIVPAVDVGVEYFFNSGRDSMKIRVTKVELVDEDSTTNAAVKATFTRISGATLDDTSELSNVTITEQVTTTTPQPDLISREATGAKVWGIPGIYTNQDPGQLIFDRPYVGSNDPLGRSARVGQFRYSTHRLDLKVGNSYLMFSSGLSTAVPTSLLDGMIFTVTRFDHIGSIGEQNSGRRVTFTTEPGGGIFFENHSSLSQYVTIYNVTKTPQPSVLTPQPDLFSSSVDNYIGSWDKATTHAAEFTFNSTGDLVLNGPKLEYSNTDNEAQTVPALDVNKDYLVYTADSIGPNTVPDLHGGMIINPAVLYPVVTNGSGIEYEVESAVEFNTHSDLSTEVAIYEIPSPVRAQVGIWDKSTIANSARESHTYTSRFTLLSQITEGGWGVFYDSRALDGTERTVLYARATDNNVVDFSNVARGDTLTIQVDDNTPVTLTVNNASYIASIARIRFSSLSLPTLVAGVTPSRNTWLSSGNTLTISDAAGTVLTINTGTFLVKSGTQFEYSIKDNSGNAVSALDTEELYLFHTADSITVDTEPTIHQGSYIHVTAIEATGSGDMAAQLVTYNRLSGEIYDEQDDISDEVSLYNVSNTVIERVGVWTPLSSGGGGTSITFNDLKTSFSAIQNEGDWGIQYDATFRESNAYVHDSGKVLDLSSGDTITVQIDSNAATQVTLTSYSRFGSGNNTVFLRWIGTIPGQPASRGWLSSGTNFTISTGSGGQVVMTSGGFLVKSDTQFEYSTTDNESSSIPALALNHLYLLYSAATIDSETAPEVSEGTRILVTAVDLTGDGDTEARLVTYTRISGTVYDEQTDLSAEVALYELI